VLEALERGDLTLTAVRMLAPHLTIANYEEVLAAARHRSKEGIQELIESLSPRPAAATVIIQVALARETHEKLQRAQALARHILPDGNVAAILDRALTLLIADLERRRFASVTSPRPSPGEHATSGRYIPSAIRRAVWLRDEGRCAFVGRSGPCGETAFLEFHHVAPYAAGGAATADNIQLRCRAHNQYEARLFFGDSLMDRFVPDACRQGMPMGHGRAPRKPEDAPPM